MKLHLKPFGILLLVAVCLSCDEKSYEDYDENDFIEVQGILIRTIRKNTFPNNVNADLYFIYNLDQDHPDTGQEKGTPYMGLSDGDPITVLVHKEDSEISFFGSGGITQEEVLLEYLDKCAQIGGDYYGVDLDLSKFWKLWNELDLK